MPKSTFGLDIVPNGAVHCAAWPKNLFRNVYRAVETGQMPAEPDWSTFEDGHKEMAICDAILESNKSQQWTDVNY